jgi:hypothetical protein
LVLAVLAGIITPVVAYLRHPDRQLERIQQELEAGRPVTLMDEAGPPPWFQPATRPADMRTSVADDGTFSVETRHLALVELLPDLKQRCYRFSVEVRHDDYFNYEGRVGIYFAHSKCGTASGETVHFFYALYFNDRYKLSNLVPHLPPVANHFELAVCRQSEPGDFLHGPRVQTLHAEFEPAQAGRNLGPWRKIAVKVTPKGVEAFWEGKAIGTRSRSRLMRTGKNLAVNFVDPGDVNRKFAFRDGLGLYVYRGVASFRRIVVEPLVEDD